MIVDCNVLVTHAGTAAAVAVIKALQGSVTNVYAVDMNLLCYARELLGPNLYKVPPCSENDTYVETLIAICTNNNIKYIVPCSNDDELMLFAERQSEFAAQGITVMLSAAKTIQLCHDKYATFQLLRDNSIPVPQTWMPDMVQGDSVDYPCMVKSRYGNGSEWVRKAEDKNALALSLKAIPEPIVQEYESGSEFTLDVVADRESSLRVVLCRERVAVKSGISVKARIVDDPELAKKAESIVKLLGVVGPCNIQFINGKCTDVNPRFSGGLGLSLAAGVNVPLVSIKIFEGLPLHKDEVSFKKDIAIVRYWEEAVVEDDDE